MTLKFANLTNLTLLVALSLSTVAAYYSIYGLTAIFAGAVIPIIIMGTMLEIAKITTTVWLRKYWHRASWVIKVYLVPAVVLLAFLTSMGIFGFLSKAHSDQNLVSGDVQAKIAIYDEKIKTAKENIEANRKQLKQMDEAVDQVMARSTSEEGASKANNIRRSQQRDRAILAKDIEANQKLIATLNDEAAPIRAQVRQVEAEVGPIKYIAAFIYGDNPDTNLLERAVRWVIILLVIVFDPLAIALVLAANSSKDWDKLVEDDVAAMNIDPEPKDVFIRPFTSEEIEKLDKANYEPDDGTLSKDQLSQISESATKFTDPGEHPDDKFEHEIAEVWPFPEPIVAADNDLGLALAIEAEGPILDKHPYLSEKFVHFEDTKPLVAKPEIKPKRKKKIKVEEPTIEPTADSDLHIMQVKQDLPYRQLNDEYVGYNGKQMRKDAAFSMYPELKKLTEDAKNPVNSGFGTSFPSIPSKGDVFTRVDMLPNKVYKFDGTRWIEIAKETSNTYLYNTMYLEYLINMLDKGQIDPELLTENERLQIEDYIKLQKIKDQKIS